MTDQELRSRLHSAVDHRLSGVTEDPFLARRVLEQQKGENTIMKKKLSLTAVAAIMLVLISVTALAASHWTGISDFLGRIVGGWQVKEEAIQKPISQQSDCTFATLTMTEAYWSEEGLHMVIQALPARDDLLVCYPEEVCDEDGNVGDMIRADGREIPLDEWRDGKQVILCEPIPAEEGWNYYERTEEGLFLILTDWNPDPDALRAGAETMHTVRCTNLQTGETEKATLTAVLPPLEMQTGHQ